MLPSVLLVLDVLGVLLKLLKSIEPGALPQWKLGKCAYWGESFFLSLLSLLGDLAVAPTLAPEPPSRGVFRKVCF